MRRLTWLLAAVFAVIGASAQAGTITQGNLSVTTRTTNGAIQDAVFQGRNYFDWGTPVSDFGFQVGSDTSSFRVNTQPNGIGVPVSEGGANNTEYTGTYNGVNFDRTYSLVPGADVLKVSTTFTNTNASSLSLAYFDTFDPDQGSNGITGFGTFMDVYTLGGTTVGQAIADSGAPYTVIAGSLDPNETVASGNPFSISDGTALNNFFSSPVDGNGIDIDSGMHIGILKTIGAGLSTTFTYYLAFGSSVESAQTAFLTAVRLDGTPTPTPAPAALLLMTMGMGLPLAGRKLGRKKAQNAA